MVAAQPLAQGAECLRNLRVTVTTVESQTAEGDDPKQGAVLDIVIALVPFFLVTVGTVPVVLYISGRLLFNHCALDLL